ncbi:hypothetical protein [Rhizobium sp. NFACC06-2]|uniref:hypothetical protein n=1 Tax=Rhizobium sp. NFACC06-2 TaxID=1566264 RepID=UPI000876BA26|nr:hypothetical protein [Rhizobium sp. NFACC06-2]SCY12610.1 hypothetical protein SAMN03159288_01363 [Rhizobium sp. NFACC06-2]
MNTLVLIKLFFRFCRVQKRMVKVTSEEDRGDMPNEEVFAILQRLSEEAREIPGEPVNAHRARFEERRRLFENTHQNNAGPRF